jgi:hypothetical protein
MGWNGFLPNHVITERREAANIAFSMGLITPQSLSPVAAATTTGNQRKQPSL